MPYVLGVVGSPRKGGNTEFLVNKALEGAQEEGATVELILLRQKKIESCDGCWTCTKTGKCHIKDDMQELYGKFEAADGIIIGSPTHCGTISSVCLKFVERLVMLMTVQRFEGDVPLHVAKTSKLAGKVGAAIVSGRRRGVQGALDTLNFNLIMNRLILAHPGVAGFVQSLELGGAIQYEDKYAVAMAVEAGRDVGKYIKKFGSGSKT